MEPKILFISRAYPPVFGGIENQNFGLSKALSEITQTKIVANRKGKKNLPFFLVKIFLTVPFVFKKYDVVLLGDGVLAPLGVWLKWLYPKKKALSIIHGLDITYAGKKSLLGKIYRLVNIPAIKKMDRLIMVGNETIFQAQKFGIDRGKCVFIPNGIFPEKICAPHSRRELEELLKTDLSEKKVIFRGGRIVKHKGLEWFIRQVMPKIPENYLLVAAGGAVSSKTVGDENNLPNCQKAVKDLGLEKRVFFFINLPQEKMEIVFNTCDLFVQPNIKVPGSMEGFGITAIEAAACEQVVLAANIEGLKDAVKNNENGLVLESGNAEEWIQKTKEILENDGFRKDFGEKARQYVLENFTWEKIAQRYLEEIKNIIGKS